MVQNKGNYSKTQAKDEDTNSTGNSNDFPGRNMITNFFASIVISGNTMHSRKHKHRTQHQPTQQEPKEMKNEVKIPNSTVGKKITMQTPLPTSLVKGSSFSKTGGMSGGTTLKPGSVSKISVPPCAPSPPAKK